MPVTRRDVLWGLGGGLAGAALTPVPWKLLDDTSIWTQRRHALPVPPRGPVTFRAAACTLCPGGCALRVRCVGARPVAVRGEARHPLGGGACAIGLTLHHLAYHPLRLAGPAVRASGRREPVALDAAVARVAPAVERAARGRPAGDGPRPAPGPRRLRRLARVCWRRSRAASTRRFPGEGETLAVLQEGLAKPQPLGLDLEGTCTLVSFGAPVLEGWGRPGRMLAARKGLRVVQVDAWRSPSAALADEWVADRPGRRRAARPGPRARRRARGGDRSGRRRAALPRARLAPESSRRARASSRSRIEALARALVRQAPTVAIGGGDPGGGPAAARRRARDRAPERRPGQRGPRGRLRPAPPPARGRVRHGQHRPIRLEDVPAGSVGRSPPRRGRRRSRPAGAAPPPRRWRRGAVVVSLSPFDGALAREADVLVPAPAPLEAWDEVLPTADASAASYAVARADPAGARRAPTDTIAFVQSLAAALRVEVAQGDARGAAARARGRDPRRGPRPARGPRRTRGYAEAAAADAARPWEALVAGGCWIDDARAAPRRLAAPAAACPRRPRSSAGPAPAAAGSGLEPRRLRRPRHRGHDAALAAPHEALPGVGPAIAARPPRRSAR